MKQMFRTDESLLLLFENTKLPFDEWTHHAHVRIAYIYLKRQDFVEALDCIRQGIKRYNLAHDVESTPGTGYHETVTVAFATLIASEMKTSPEKVDSTTFIATHPSLSDPRVLERYYSKRALQKEDARGRFMPPDRRSLSLVLDNPVAEQ